MRFSILKKITLIREDPAQRKLAALAAAVCAVFVLFWFFVYVPQRAQMVGLKNELAAARARSHELQALVGMGRDIREGIRLVQETQARLEKKFPRDDGALLMPLPQAAAEAGIDIVSLKHFDVVSYPHPASVDGAVLKYVPVSLEVRGYYRDLVEFIRRMRETVPGILFVDTMRLAPAAGGDSRLDAVLDFKLFFLG